MEISQQQLIENYIRKSKVNPIRILVLVSTIFKIVLVKGTKTFLGLETEISGYRLRNLG